MRRESRSFGCGFPPEETAASFHTTVGRFPHFHCQCGYENLQWDPNRLVFKGTIFARPYLNERCRLALKQSQTVMFIHEMSDSECRRALQSTTIGRLACARDNQPYVVPIYFGFDGTYLYGFTTVGQKIEWMRSNPMVCFEMDQVTSDNEWVSIVAFGRYEELPDTQDYQFARAQAHELLQRRAMWWEPAYVSEQHRDQPHSLTPIFYRIHIEKMTGHRATPEEAQEVSSDVSALEVKRGWLNKLLHP